MIKVSVNPKLIQMRKPMSILKQMKQTHPSKYGLVESSGRSLMGLITNF